MWLKGEQKNGSRILNGQNLVGGLSLTAMNVARKAKINPRISDKRNGIFVQGDVKELLIQKSHLINNRIIGVFGKQMNQSGYILRDIENLIQRGLPILKQGDTRERETQRDNTLLRSGENFAENSNGDVRSVRKEESLQKIILNPFRWVGQIMSLIFNPYVVLVIVVSGRNSTSRPSF